MQTVASLVALEERLTEARADSAGTAEELDALVALATRLVSDAERRGRLAREGVELATRLGDDVARLLCSAMVAEFQCRQGHPADALAEALQTLGEAQRLGDPRALAQAHHAVAWCYDELDCASEALEHARQALDGYQRAGDVFGEARAVGLHASLSWYLGENPLASELYERAYELYLACDEPSGAGVMASAIADLQLEAGDAAAAAAMCERSLAEFQRAGMPIDAHMGMLSYAEALAATGQYDLAALWAKRAHEHIQLADGTVANPSYEACILTVTARVVQLPCGDLDGARAGLERAVAIADAIGLVRSAAEAETLLAETLHASGDLAGAYDHLLRGRKLTEEVARTMHDGRVRGLRVRFEVEQARREAVRYREQARAQAELIAELERLNAEVVQLSQTDPLTGIANRRFMNERLAQLCETTSRYGSPLAVAVFDVDRFKDINDRHGHGVGDAVLVALADLMRRHVRSADLPSRLGGDEFVILMPETTSHTALAACQRLQTAVRAHPWADIAPDLAVSITIGLADGTAEADPEEVMRRADNALYQGKRAGRDTVAQL